MKITRKLPSKSQIIQVFAVISILIYGWTTYRLIQKLPSWLFYLHSSEIISNYSFTLAFNFLEALLVISLILMINFLLPARIFMDKFVARGSLLSIFNLGYLMYLANAIGQSKSSQFPSALFKWAPLMFLISSLLAILLPFLQPVQKIADELADRAVVFLYLLLPLTALGLLLFLFINLF